MKPIEDEGGIEQFPTVDIDNQALQFGKYKGQTPGQIAEHDPDYIIWLYQEYDAYHARQLCTEALYRACQSDRADSGDGDDDFRELDFGGYQ